MKIETEDLINLLTKAFNTGFNKYEVVETEVKWILTKYLKENGIKD